MNQQQYNPWYPQQYPFQFGYPPPQYIHLPPGTTHKDAERAAKKALLKFQKELVKQKVEEDKKKKDNAPKPPMIPVGTAVLLMLTFGLPVGGGFWLLMKAVGEAIVRGLVP